ncbi:MAG: hypothetical protein F7B17_02955 [Desulfurococcales archaeon]|nr:hypothetical protein [Desulfurococcales archaeon]
MARDFISALVAEGSVQAYIVNIVNYVVVDSVDEAYHLMTVLLATQINAAVREPPG